VIYDKVTGLWILPKSRFKLTRVDINRINTFAKKLGLTPPKDMVV
jgi:hypothetical protein